MYGLTLGWFFGRMGCFSAHDHPGMPTDFFLGVPGMSEAIGCTVDVPCHDLGLYEALWSGAMCLLFVFLDRKPRFQGFYVGLLCAAYGPFRLFLDSMRHPDTDARYFGLTPAQYGSILIGLAGLAVLYYNRNTTPTRILTGAAVQPGKASDSGESG